MTILVTGGAGFIGSNFIFNWMSHHNELLINLDNLTYAGNVTKYKLLENSKNYLFVKGDINDDSLILQLLIKHTVRAIIHFAAESHVDRSIQSPDAFIQTNIVGTFKLLQAALAYWGKLNRNMDFRFLHISTDEVFGALLPDEPPFTELSCYAPNSPYAASKASSDHLVRAFHHTYGLPVLSINCSNNYGPYQFPEKFIPLCIGHALMNKPLPLYGDGQQVRDWLYVDDHCEAIRQVLNAGKMGERYNVGGGNEKTNRYVAETICSILDEKIPKSNGCSYKEQIQCVRDRPGHDFRYAINASKIRRDLGWKPRETFESGLEKTVSWYLENQDWLYHKMVEKKEDYCA